MVRQILPETDVAPVASSGAMDAPETLFKAALPHYTSPALDPERLQAAFDAIQNADNKALAAAYMHRELQGHWRYRPLSKKRGCIAFFRGQSIDHPGTRAQHVLDVLEVLVESGPTHIFEQNTSFVEGFANARLKSKATLTKAEAQKLPKHRSPLSADSAARLRRSFYAFVLDNHPADIADNHATWPEPVAGPTTRRLLTQQQVRIVQASRIMVPTRALLAAARMLDVPLLRIATARMVRRHGPLVYLHLPATKAMPEGLVVPILVDGKAVEDLAAERAAEKRLDEPLFPKDLDHRVRQFGAGLGFKVSCTILRESFWASLLVIKPGCDAYLYAISGLKGIKPIRRLRKEVERLMAAGHDLALPSSFGYSYTEIPCHECGHGNDTDAGEFCAKCGCQLTMNLDATSMAKAALRAIIDQLFDAGMRFSPQDVERAMRPLGGAA